MRKSKFEIQREAVRQSEKRIIHKEGCLGSILAMAVLVFCVLVSSLLAYRSADPEWLIIGFTKRYGMQFSIWLLGGATILIVLLLSINFKWSRANNFREKRILEKGISLTILIALLTFTGLLISLITSGGKEWAIMGLAKRFGMERSLWLLGASIGSIIICIIIYMGYSLLANRLRDRLKKKSKQN